METVTPPELGDPIAHYSHGTQARDLVFVAGQLALDNEGNIIAPGDIAEQTRIVIGNVESVLRAAGCSLTDVVSTTVYVSTFDGYKEYDRAYADAFGSHRPARATVGADLVKAEALVEIQAIAIKGS